MKWHIELIKPQTFVMDVEADDREAAIDVALMRTPDDDPTGWDVYFAGPVSSATDDSGVRLKDLG